MTTCIKCRYYNEVRYECRYSPPVRLPREFKEDATEGNRVRNEEIKWGWPQTGPNDWCGNLLYRLNGDER